MDRRTDRRTTFVSLGLLYNIDMSSSEEVVRYGKDVCDAILQSSSDHSSPALPAAAAAARGVRVKAVSDSWTMPLPDWCGVAKQDRCLWLHGCRVGPVQGATVRYSGGEHTVARYTATVKMQLHFVELTTLCVTVTRTWNSPPTCRFYCLRLRESMKHSVLTFASRCQISSLTDWSLESEVWTDSLLLVTPRHLSRSIGYITPDCTALETSVSALPAFYLFSICIELSNRKPDYSHRTSLLRWGCMGCTCALIPRCWMIGYINVINRGIEATQCGGLSDALWQLVGSGGGRRWLDWELVREEADDKQRQPRTSVQLLDVQCDVRGERCYPNCDGLVTLSVTRVRQTSG